MTVQHRKLEILIASDGSTDGTCDVARLFESPTVRLLDLTRNRRKTAVLNDPFAQAPTDIVLLSDEPP